MPVWLHPLHGPDAAQRFQPHKLAGRAERSRGENLSGCLQQLLEQGHDRWQDPGGCTVVKFQDGEVATQFSPTGADFSLPLLCADVTWARVPTPELDVCGMQTPFDRLETEEIPDLKYLIGVAPRWKRMHIAALDSFDDPGTDEVWVLGASFVPGTAEMEAFLAALQRSGALRWDIDKEYVFHKQVIGRGTASITRRGMLRSGFRELDSLMDEQSNSEEEHPPTSVPSAPVAIKIMKHPETEEEAQAIVSEVRFLAESAQHPNIVRLHGTFCVKWRSKSLWLLALELCSGGRLQDHVKIYGPLERVSGEAASVALLSAVSRLHSRRILHRDIRPGNILLADNLRPVLVNFGNAACFDDTARPRKATMDGYTAPEVVDTRLGSCGPASDVFSVAASILFMLTGIEPFTDLASAKCTQQTLTGNPSVDETAASKIENRSVVVVLQRLLARNARKRPTAGQACMMLHEEASDEVQELAVCEEAMRLLSVGSPRGSAKSSGLESITEALEEPAAATTREGTDLDFDLSSHPEISGPPGPRPGGYARPPEPGEAANLAGLVPCPPSSPSPRRNRLFSGRLRAGKSQE